MTGSDLQTKLRNYYLSQGDIGDEVQIENFVHIQAGWESEIYAFDLQAGAKETEELILRIFPGNDAQQKSEREFKNLERLAVLNFPVPRVYSIEKDSSYIRNPFVIMERIPGETLWGALFSPEVDNVDGLIDSFSQVYVLLHRLDYLPFLGDLDTSISSGKKSGVISQLEQWRAAYSQFPIPDFLPLLDWLDEHAADLTRNFPSVLHWDFHPENIILKPDGSMVVIDWTGLQVSDLRFDLAWTLMLITAYEGEKWRKVFLESYERAADEKIPGMEFFDVAACTRRLYSIAGSISAGAEKLGMRPGAEDIMQNQIEPTMVVYEKLNQLTGINLPSIEKWLNG